MAHSRWRINLRVVVGKQVEAVNWIRVYLLFLCVSLCLFASPTNKLHQHFSSFVNVQSAPKMQSTIFLHEIYFKLIVARHGINYTEQTTKFKGFLCTLLHHPSPFGCVCVYYCDRLNETGVVGFYLRKTLYIHLFTLLCPAFAFFCRHFLSFSLICIAFFSYWIRRFHFLVR